jgi:hypothetical protein
MRPTLLLPLGFILPVSVSAGLAASVFRDTPALPSLLTPSPVLDVSGKGNDRKLPPLTDAEAAHLAIATRPLFAENRQLEKVAEAEPLREPDPEPMAEPEPIPESYVEDVPEPTTAAAEPPPDFPDLQAIGYVSESGTPRVLIRNPATGNEAWMAVGDRLDTWTLVEITQEAAKFEAEGTQVAVKLFE